MMLEWGEGQQEVIKLANVQNLTENPYEALQQGNVDQ